jgi:uncharacterized membrane protein
MDVASKTHSSLMLFTVFPALAILTVISYERRSNENKMWQWNDTNGKETDRALKGMSALICTDFFLSYVGAIALH